MWLVYVLTDAQQDAISPTPGDERTDCLVAVGSPGLHMAQIYAIFELLIKLRFKRYIAARVGAKKKNKCRVNFGGQCTVK